MPPHGAASSRRGWATVPAKRHRLRAPTGGNTMSEQKEKEGAGAPLKESATPASAGSTVAGATGAASVQTVRVVLSLTTEQRLEALRKGFQVEKSGLVIEVPITSPALEGVAADGEGYLKRSTNYHVELDYTAFVLQGKTVDDAYADYQKRFEKYEKEQEEKQRKMKEKKAMIKQAILAQFPSVQVEGDDGEYDVLYASYTSGATSDRVGIYLTPTYANTTVEQAIREVEELVKSVEERENKRKIEQAKKETEEREKAEWIKTHGSQHLKEAFARGYDCQRLYILERVAKELPGYEVYQFDGRDAWELHNRSCPSQEALEEVQRLEAQGFHPIVKWAKLAPGDEDEGGEAEIVYIEDFHGYETYKIIHLEEDDDC